MPASNEGIRQKSLSGPELVKIIERDVHEMLTRDGMFNINIAFPRVSYEVRVTMHMDNPLYPTHVNSAFSRPASKQEVEKEPSLAAIETLPLQEPLTDEETVFAEERHREIASPNMARVEHELPLTVEKRNHDSGHFETKEITFKGDLPDPATVGNIVSDSSPIENARAVLGLPPKKSRKGKK